jgi:anaerobic selenocysteine-containing dehydrogenase
MAEPRALVYGRVGACTQEFGGLTLWLIYCLNAVTGHLDREGGMMFAEPAVDLTRAYGSRGHYGRFHSRVRALPEFSNELPVAALAEEITTPGQGQVRALFTLAGNPVLSTPNGGQLDAAFGQLEFMVSIDLYLNESSRHAHLILPPTSPLERSHYDIALSGFAVRNVTRFNEAVLAKPEGTLHDWEIFVGLAKAFAAHTGADLKPTMAPEQMIDMGLRFGPYGDKSAHKLSLAALREQPHGLDLGPLKANLAARLKTANKTIEAAPALLLADLQRLADAPVSNPEQLLLIGRRHVRSNNSWMHNYHRLVKGKPRHQLLMHPDDLVVRGLADGQRVCVRSRVGSLEVEVASSSDMMPGVVSLPHGWGHGRQGVQLAIARAQPGASANDLTDERQLDALSGNAALNGVPVEVLST